MAAIDPNTQAMAAKMQAARGGAPMQRPPMAAAQQEAPAEDQTVAQVKMLLTKALQLLSGGGQ